MTDDEFLSLTPGQLQVLSKRWLETETAKRKERDYHTAKICWAIFEPQRDRKKRSKPFTVEDFMPQQQKEVKQQSAEEQTTVLLQLFGGVKK